MKIHNFNITKYGIEIIYAYLQLNTIIINLHLYCIRKCFKILKFSFIKTLQFLITNLRNFR